jgi:hypothetical protein
VKLLAILLIPILAALLNRHRGGWLPSPFDPLYNLIRGKPTWASSTQTARVDYSLGMSFLLTWSVVAGPHSLTEWGWIVVFFSAPIWFVFEAFIPLGKNMGESSDLQFAEMCAGGLANVAGICFILYYWSLPWWGLALFGLMKGPVYKLAQRFNYTAPSGLFLGPSGLVSGFTAVGECLFGACLGLGVLSAGFIP